MTNLAIQAGKEVLSAVLSLGGGTNIFGQQRPLPSKTKKNKILLNKGAPHTPQKRSKKMLLDLSGNDDEESDEEESDEEESDDEESDDEESNDEESNDEDSDEEESDDEFIEQKLTQDEHSRLLELGYPVSAQTMALYRSSAFKGRSSIKVIDDMIFKGDSAKEDKPGKSDEPNQPNEDKAGRDQNSVNFLTKNLEGFISGQLDNYQKKDDKEIAKTVELKPESTPEVDIVKEANQDELIKDNLDSVKTDAEEQPNYEGNSLKIQEELVNKPQTSSADNLIDIVEEKKLEDDQMDHDKQEDIEEVEEKDDSEDQVIEVASNSSNEILEAPDEVPASEANQIVPEETEDAEKIRDSETEIEKIEESPDLEDENSYAKEDAIEVVNEDIKEDLISEHSSSSSSNSTPDLPQEPEQEIKEQDKPENPEEADLKAVVDTTSNNDVYLRYIN